MKSARPVFLLLAFLVLLAGATIVQSQSGSGRKEDGSLQVQDPEKSLKEIRTKLKETKRALAREGEYSCCIAPSCDFCAVSVGRCACNENLSSGDPVCHECKGGWQAGLGAIDGIKAEDVKTLSPEMTKMMYEARAKKYLMR